MTLTWEIPSFAMVFPDNRSKETGAMFQISMFSGTSEAPRSGWTVVQWCHNGITSHPEPSNSCVQLEVLWVILKVFRWWSCRTGTRWKITSSKLMAAACWELQENIVFSWKICPTGQVYLAWFFEKVSHCYDFIGSSATSTNLDHIYTYLLLHAIAVPACTQSTGPFLHNRKNSTICTAHASISLVGLLWGRISGDRCCVRWFGLSSL